ncbi:TMEM230 [Branchiostoma lanceolatum]|uniref:TMEM230 protein n=1 Tax=Branchiostoma lanceolatum TaxID=7740 RepID=A0A8K0EIT2_BRALA|nr:TMEM230 [Branchiostoma lanceolatum]
MLAENHSHPHDVSQRTYSAALHLSDTPPGAPPHGARLPESRLPEPRLSEPASGAPPHGAPPSGAPPSGVPPPGAPPPAMRMRNSRPNTAGARYSRLPQDDDGFIDLQFERPPRKVPYKAIGLAAVLFLLGSALLTVGALLLSGVYIDPQYADRTCPSCR